MMSSKQKVYPGKVFGRWTVLFKCEEHCTEFKGSHWFCKCECGTQRYTSGNSLRSGSKSCGCLRRENKGRKSFRTKLESTYNQLFNRYKNDARNRNLDFYLTSKQFNLLIGSNCYYCNCPPSNGIITRYSGIDRVNNEQGYIITNCVSCCIKCNSDKKSITPNIIKKAYEFLYGI